MVYAEDLNYWKSSQAGPDAWMEKAKREIRTIGGQIKAEMFGQDETGRAAYMLSFALGPDTFRLMWPVLPCRVPSDVNNRAARVQAATLLYHDVKHKCVTAKFKGVRSAFIEYFLLENGQTVGQAADSTNTLLSKLPVLPALGRG